MESDFSSPQEIATLLTLSRDLSKDLNTQLGVSIPGLENAITGGLVTSGPVVVQGQVKTQYGKFNFS